MSEIEPTRSTDIRDVILEAIAHLEHVLPSQAPIKKFVHHNTLEGFQHLPFAEALAAAKKLTGHYAYLPASVFRQFYAEGRITHDDLCAVLDKDASLNSAAIIFEDGERRLRQADVYLGCLLHPIKPITNSQLNWQIEEMHALISFQEDVSPDSRRRLMNAARRQGCESIAEAIFDLSNACLEKLGLKYYLLHPEELLELGVSQMDTSMSELAIQDDEQQDNSNPTMHRLVRKEAEHLLQQQLDRIGAEFTLRGFLQMLTGHDILQEAHTVLIRHISAYLDQGVAAWHPTGRDKGFYTAWRQSAGHDLAWLFDNLHNWQQELEILPDNSLDAIVHELQLMGLPRARWADYIQRLALELPGWSGMFLWHHNHPASDELPVQNIQFTDYLAVRLVLERIFAVRLSGQFWRIEPRLDMLRQYFRRHRSEFIVRYLSQTNRLPEYLVTRAHRLVRQTDNLHAGYHEWITLADQIWSWRHNPMADRPTGYSVLHSGWCLFRLAQHLGLSGADIRALEKPQLEQLFACLDKMDEEQSGFIWLQAYERHYQAQLFNAIINNQQRADRQEDTGRPFAQVIFCMDDREESFRRHLEEVNPAIETYGAAGFFGVAVNWQGLDDESHSALCPIVVTPSHDIHELPETGQTKQHRHHQQRRRLRLGLQNILLQESRRNLLTASLLIMLAAPLGLLTLAGKLFSPLGHHRLSRRLLAMFEPSVKTRLSLNTEQPELAASPEAPRLGFTDREQADRVENFLRTIGLTQDFAAFIVLAGHGSSSRNNPHLSAYDCGACSGFHGGPNARIFAAMANRREVRHVLQQRGIVIPDSSWFIGSEHNTGDDVISWYDLDAVPTQLRPALQQLQQAMKETCLRSAHERCRRFASAPRRLDAAHAFRHVNKRSFDISQARPELGHATNAAAFIGRRRISRGAFWDRRVFLISYDPSQDAEGKIVEAILLAAGPVGAGINLEYYFSTVNNEGYGCGSKVTHNIAGLLGVMDGASSDLRTGLPKQMIEIHEAMRLQLIVEATPEILTAIYERQPPLRELIANGWLLLTALHPDTGELFPFEPARGFVKWQGQPRPLARVKRSSDWYSGQQGPLPFALIETGAVNAK